MLLVVGLGNPGKEHARDRHNVGFMVVDALAAEVRADAFRERFSGLCARAELAGEPALLLKPQTWMNASGRSVRAAMAFYKLPPADLLVIHDELDLPFGAVRLKRGGGHAGHNGLRSIVEACGTPEFGRVRVGIGRPPPDFPGDVPENVINFVLSGVGAAEAATLSDTLKQAAESVLEVAARGFDAAMNVRNTRRRPAKPPPEPEGKGV